MKGIIIYKGKYGSTRQYAEWLGAELNLPVTASDNTSKEQLAEYDFLVLGGAVYMGKILIHNWLKKNIGAMQGKKIFVFVVCGTPPAKKAELEKYKQAGVPAEIRNSAEVYYLPGRMRLKDLSWFDRFMLKMGARLTKDPEAKKEMLMEFDELKKENMNELVKAVRKFCSVRNFAPQVMNT